MGNTEKFDMMANFYDTKERIEVTKICSQVMKEYIIDGKNKTAIDFGCGTGLIGMDLLDEFKSILFLDTSQNMLNIVSTKLEEAQASNGSTLCFDFESSNSDMKADYIFMAQVLIHIKEYKPVLEKLYDILNENGHLIIVDFDKNPNISSDLVHNGFDQEELKETLSQIGFNNISSKNFYSGKNMFMNKDADVFIMDATK